MKKIISSIIYLMILSGAVFGQTGITVGTGAEVTVGQGATINVSNGNFSVLVEENARGSFLEIGDLTFSGSGEAMMQQYLTKDQWHAVTSPMSNEDIGVYEWMYLYSWDEPSKDWTNLILPETLPLNPGEGYYVWNTLDTNTIFPNTPYYTVTHNGIFNKNDIVTSPTFTSGGQGSQNKGWNLLGNPFPCAIDWNGHADWNLVNVESTVYFGDYTVSGNYPEWNWETQTGTLGKTDGYITATQGFWVKTSKKNPTPSLTIPVSQRLHSNTTPFYKSESSINEILRLRVDGNGYFDETIIGFIPDATYDYDHYDAYKMIGRDEAPQLYSIVGDEMMTMNFLPEVSDDMIVPLGFEVGAPGIYTIDATQIEGFDNALFIYIEDLKENTVQDLKSNPQYVFTATTFDETERFLIHFKNTVFAIDGNELSRGIKITAKGNQLIVNVSDTYEGDLQMHNVIGQEIGNYHLTSGNHEIPVSVNGIVLVTWLSREGVISKKLFFN